MFDNEVHFIDQWHIEGTVQEVYDIMLFGKMAEWWPSVFRKYDLLEAGDERGQGQRIDVLSKAWLPYDLRWESLITEVNPPNAYRQVVKGDFDGTGDWTFVQNGPWVDVTLDWRIRAQKPLLRFASALCHPLLVPIYRWNHRWCMLRGEESIWLELARRHAQTPEQRALVPAPPAPTSSIPSVIFALLGGVMLSRLVARILRGRKNRP